MLQFTDNSDLITFSHQLIKEPGIGFVHHKMTVCPFEIIKLNQIERTGYIVLQSSKDDGRGVCAATPIQQVVRLLPKHRAAVFCRDEEWSIP